METRNKFTLNITVQPADIDALGHVNNVVYLRWVQDAAEAHWRMISSPEINEKWIWVVVRHEIDYLRAAGAGDLLSAVTWVGANDGARSMRYTQINQQHTGLSVVAAVTTWCLLDAKTKRPKKIDETITRLF